MIINGGSPKSYKRLKLKSRVFFLAGHIVANNLLYIKDDCNWFTGDWNLYDTIIVSSIT